MILMQGKDTSKGAVKVPFFKITEWPVIHHG